MSETTPTFREQYLKAVANLLAKRGKFVRSDAYPRDGGKPNPWGKAGDYDEHALTYSWADHGHLVSGDRYGDACSVQKIDIDTLREQSLSQFENTFTSNKMVSGLEAKATCACGKYTSRWLRWEGSVSDAMDIMLKEES